MAKVRVVNNNLDQNLNGDSFDNTASQTIFRFGKFRTTSNFDGRQLIDYSKELSTFVRPVTLETLELTKTESANIVVNTKNAVLKLDNTNLNTFAKFGSAYEFLRVSIENIIVNYPGSLFVNSQIERSGNNTVYDFNYDPILNITTFKIPSVFTETNFNLVYNRGNNSSPDNNELKNLNLSYSKYVVWSTRISDDNSHFIIGFTGDTANDPFLYVQCLGNPFPSLSGGSTTGRIDFHLKPSTVVFDDFRMGLNEYERYIVSKRQKTNGFEFQLKDPTLLDSGKISYNNRNLLWVTGDGYNIDINTPAYRKFLESVLGIGNKYDKIKTDLIARFLSPASIQTYDLTEDKKISKLLRIYGAEFDQLKQFIDSLVNINKITYDGKQNLPDQVVSNLARAFGWNYFQLVKEEELVDKILGATEPEKDLTKDLTPAQVDIEMWRRILLNTNYFWKTKGTRDAIKAMFLLIGIPEPFINITEYVYTVDGRIDPREVPLTLDDLPSASLPYDSNGYPIAPVETDNFYFQISGNADSGQAYMNNFRNVGFNLMQQVDNKKSWVQTGSTYRRHYSSPTYYQLDSRLVLNTKEVDIALDTARGIEYDVYKYAQDDYKINSSGYTLNYSFVNLSLGVTGTTQNIFKLPQTHDGDFEVRFNGILLNSGKEYTTSGGTTTGNSESDYTIVGDVLTLSGNARNNNSNRDVVQVTYIYSGNTSTPISGLTVSYVVSRVKPNPTGTKIMLPEIPSGDVQLTINGIAATKGTSQFQADYVINPSNPQELIIQNSTLISYFATNPYAQIAMVHVNQANLVNARSEVVRVDSLTSGKVYFKPSANKTIFRLNYKINSAETVKVLVDGIALEPGVDYTVNPNNPFELYLPPGINFGSVLTAYYLVSENLVFDSIINDEFGLGDISNLSFLEFLELVESRMVNATNRKIITDFKGGWYPTILKIYTTYLNRSNLPSSDPQQSNGYTFENLYPFLNKYNAFFQRFVDQLLPATIIQRKGGLLIRNTIFTKQKFTYKRGVHFDDPNPVVKKINYLGSDGATYLKRPLEQFAGWTDDFVFIDDLCEKFEVGGIHVTYPATTTTTTRFPLNTIMYFTNTQSVWQPLSNPFGNASTEKFNLTFAPDILPDYTINLRLNFESYYSGNTGSGNGHVLAEVEVRKNNVVVYSHSNNTDVTTTVETELFSRNYDISIVAGDTIEIILYNVATHIQEITAEVVSTRTRLSATELNVTPNGSITSFIPSFVENESNN